MIGAIVEEVERALIEACRRGHAEVVEFTVAPRYPSAEEPRGGHEWLIEFAEPPRAPSVFVRALAEKLQTLNTDYRTKRTGDGGMIAPHALELPAGNLHLRQGPPGTNHRADPVSPLTALNAA